jgi:hypothetical protein
MIVFNQGFEEMNLPEIGEPSEKIRNSFRIDENWSAM